MRDGGDGASDEEKGGEGGDLFKEGDQYLVTKFRDEGPASKPPKAPSSTQVDLNNK